MKKMYEETCWGYYVMSVVLGLLLALSVAMALEVGVMDAMNGASSEMLDALDNAWTYLPLGLVDVFHFTFGEHSQTIAMVTISIAAVVVFVQMSGTSKSRTKMLQAVAVAFLALLVMLAYRYASHGWVQNGVLALVPVMLMVIPLTILRKTQQPVMKDKMTLWGRLCNSRIACEVCRFVNTHHLSSAVIFVIAVILLFVVAPAVISYLFG